MEGKKMEGFLSDFFQRHIDPLSPVYEQTKTYRYIPPRVVKVTKIKVRYEPSEHHFVKNPLDSTKLSWKPF